MLFGDFRAFYCGAAAVAHGWNPYATAGIYACEHAAMPLGLFAAQGGVAVPAPFPGYALALFVPLTVLHYLAACVVWLLILLAAIALSVRALCELLGRPPTPLLWSLVTGFAIVSMPFGELGPVLVAAISWMAVGLRRGAWWLAALAGGLAMLEPHAALPSLLAVFAFVPQMRVRMAVVGALLLVIDVLSGGPSIAFSYLRDVLPAHAHSELASRVQYGMTWIVHALGASDRAAIAGGEISYAFMTLLGLAVTRALLVHRRDLAYAALVPAAFAVTGGTFMHYTQIMAAIPAALLLYEQRDGTARKLLAGALLLLIFPWQWVLAQPLLVPVFAVVCGALAVAILRWSPSAALRTALATAILAGAIVAAGFYFGPGMNAQPHIAVAHGALAEYGWERFVRAQLASTSIIWWIVKAPTWIGLLLLCSSGAYAALQSASERRARQPEAATAATG